MATTNVANSGDNSKGDTVEIISGTAQEVVDLVRDRRLNYGDVEIIYMRNDWGGQPDTYSVKITYKIPTV